ncbi:MAG TPA: sigma-54 dependent transcriptional regulator [Steroidobacteraceae bacterium]|jgi:DNA-binding NtrC family response regulator|nr:sigma-54 dependent transcriptional regulator [Steroidobacteraceae bacterium]
MTTNKILVVDDELDIRRLLQEILTEEGYDVEVAADAGQARAARARQTPDLVLLDIWMPDTDGISLLREWSNDAGESCPVVMMSGHGTVETAVEATRLGAYDFVEKPLSLAKLLRTVERALDARARRPSGKFAAPGSSGVAAPIGRSRTMTQLRSELTRMAAFNTPLLLLGESGCDREMLARFVHQSGPTAGGPFVVLDSRTLSDDNAATRLLGPEESQPGLIEQARKGTLYIGDVEDLPDETQRLLSGVLETGRYTRITGGDSILLEARIISSARPGIVNHVAADAFRRDLYAQLSALVVRVPALRDYAEDVPELLRQYVDELTESEGLRFRRFSVAAQNRLRNYPWPDNVRELRNLTRRFLHNPGQEEIGLEEVERELQAQTPANEPLVKHDLLALPLREAREQFERAYLQQQLLLCNGKVGLLAKRVDMERTHLYRKLRSLGIEIGHGADD